MKPFRAVVMVLCILVMISSVAGSAFATGAAVFYDGARQLTIYYLSDYSQTFAYYSVNGVSWTERPGVRMTDAGYQENYTRLTVRLGSNKGLYVAFTDGKQNWDFDMDSKGKNRYYYIPASFGSATVAAGTIVKGKPDVPVVKVSKASVASAKPANKPAISRPNFGKPTFGSTAAPVKTAAPVVTDAPEFTEEPVVTEQPTAKPTATAKPTPKPTVKPSAGGDKFTWDNATVYFVITDRFVNGDTSNDNSFGRVQRDATGKNIGTFHGGDIKGLIQKLEDGYFTKLGVNAIWMTAPYEQMHGFVGGGKSGDFAHYAYHGYYPLDFTAMDPNMGTIEDMRKFVDLAHSKGIRVLLDVVMNHVGYGTLKDMEDYNFAKRNGIDSSWKPSNGQSWYGYHDSLDYKDSESWGRWWGSQWVRAGIAGYTDCDAGSDLKICLGSLADVLTESNAKVGLPPVLKTKWGKETSGFEKYNVPAAIKYRKDMGMNPSEYISKWLTAWVEEFGIDGFRVDTAKHVDIYRWAMLKKDGEEALAKWRANNADDPASKWDEKFWMVGEVWDHGVNKSNYFQNGFDAVINFKFKGVNVDNPEDMFTNYANQLNNDDSFNVLSYISSHDTSLYDRGRLMQAGTALLLAPGAVQIYYGDESARPFGETGSDPDQGTRSSMNWNSVNTQLLQHWQKLGAFRNQHPAIGAGTHRKIGDGPYTFSRTYSKNGIEDKVVIALNAQNSASINVGGVFADGDTVRDAYNGKEYEVSGGKVNASGIQNGIVLLELAQ